MPAITINDLAQFRPIVGELVVEPDGWGVVGTPTNFYATAEAHTMAGELFDMPIEVRWTPSSYVFDYGDGTTESTEASGTAWRGTEESWTETATSHVYAERSDVTASLTVVFTAEVDAGGGWFAVPGTLPVDAPSVGVKVFEVDTVLTNGDCMANPSAAGCG
ncbi:PKD domain-containing protein [Agrococcus sp. DT81.2]|uniref:PKD domain-containing protein n=1 Tax=Agrococcus sp. DT81.2 TaxID=3393414 RepID=UPI003CE4EA8E